MKKGFSLFELIIVMTIAGIIYSAMVYAGSKQRDNAIYSSFLIYINNINEIGCKKFVEDNNVSYFNNANLSIPYSDIITVLNITNDTYAGISPNGKPITFNYNNMSCVAEVTIPTEFLDESLLSFKIDKTIIGTDTKIKLNSQIKLDSSTKNYLFEKMQNDKGGDFDITNNTTNAVAKPLYYVTHNGSELNNRSVDNLNEKTYNSLSYVHIPSKTIPVDMGYIK